MTASPLDVLAYELQKRGVAVREGAKKLDSAKNHNSSAMFVTLQREAKQRVTAASRKKELSSAPAKLERVIPAPKPKRKPVS